MSSDAFLLLGMAQRGFLPARLAARSRHGTPGLAIALSSAGILLLVPLSFLQIVDLLNAVYLPGATAGVCGVHRAARARAEACAPVSRAVGHDWVHTDADTCRRPALHLTTPALHRAQLVPAGVDGGHRGHRHPVCSFSCGSRARGGGAPLLGTRPTISGNWWPHVAMARAMARWQTRIWLHHHPAPEVCPEGGAFDGGLLLDDGGGGGGGDAAGRHHQWADAAGSSREQVGGWAGVIMREF